MHADIHAGGALNVAGSIYRGFMADITPLYRVPSVLTLPGERLISHGVYLFRCPLCGNEFRYDDPYGPVCTGTSTTQDEHAPEAMRLVARLAPKVTV